MRTYPIIRLASTLTFLYFVFLPSLAHAQDEDETAIAADTEADPEAIATVADEAETSTEPLLTADETPNIICLGHDNPCIRVRGEPGGAYWAIEKRVFMRWGRGAGNIEARIEMASTKLA